MKLVTEQQSSSDPKLVSEVEQMLSVLGGAPTHDSVRLPGTRVGKYEIERVLHCHGQAVVALARDPDLERQVILKLYHAAETDKQRARLINEGRALARIQSRHVATVFAVEELDDYVFLVIEYVRGMSVRELLTERRQKGGVTVDESLRVVREIAEGLTHVHKLGLLHRDLKPANVMITPDGEVKLIDFGLVSLVDAEAAKDRSGTPAYMAPECARASYDSIVDQRSDLFGAGAILYDMLCGQPPFAADTSERSRVRAIAGDVDPVQEIQSAIPDPVADVCMQCLSEDPEERFASAHDLINGLDAVIVSEGASSGGKLISIWPWLAFATLSMALLGGFFALQDGGLSFFNGESQGDKVYATPLLEQDEQIRFRNRELADRYIQDNDDSNAVLSQTVDGRCVWLVEMHVDGFSLRNQASGRYLIAEDWEVFTSQSLELGGYWQIEDNGNDSVSLRNVSTGRYLDGDGPVDAYDVDESEEIKDDDSWIVERL